MRSNKKALLITTCLLLIIWAGNTLCAAFNKQNYRFNNNAPAYTDYAGAAACVSCHRAICDSQFITAHTLTSNRAAGQYIKGSFEEGSNHFIYNNLIQVVLDSNDGRFWQTALANGAPYESHAFDIVIGSGRKGQTYLYWDSTSLFQLPVSYYTPFNTWCNSPGFSGNFPQFNRQIPPRCLECHGTYAHTITGTGNNISYDSSQIQYGVSCERCHGPAAKHVAYHRAHPADTTAMFILKISRLSRQQKLDACALCHSGIRQAVQPVFSFQTGDKLDDYSLPNYNTDSASMLDVHGNQFGLLTASKCFQHSKMDCSSCHNTHVNEVNQPVTFAQRCAACHANVQHTTFKAPASASFVTGNCIACHMPELASKKITLQLSGRQQTTPDYVRSHRIAIYPEQTKAVLDKRKAE